MDNDHHKAANKCLVSFRECLGALAGFLPILVQFAEINRALARDAAAAGCDSLAAQKSAAAEVEARVAYRIAVVLGAEKLSPEDAEREGMVRLQVVAALLGTKPSAQPITQHQPLSMPPPAPYMPQSVDNQPDVRVSGAGICADSWRGCVCTGCLVFTHACCRAGTSFPHSSQQVFSSQTTGSTPSPSLFRGSVRWVVVSLLAVTDLLAMSLCDKRSLSPSTPCSSQTESIAKRARDT